jgi:protein tyrosine phosphatase (PTP) superfamily phosphohydrolase (DUF442 family)
MEASTPLTGALPTAGSPPTVRRPRRLVVAGVVIAAVALVVGGWYAHWTLIARRFQTITANKVYQSGAIEPDRLTDVVREHGIRTVIDFRRGDDEQGTVDAEAQALAGVGVAHVHLPTGQVPPPETVAGFLKVMDDPDRYPVLIHCYHGEGRSSLFVALYRIEYEGWTNEQARQATRAFPELSSFGHDERKGIFLREYVRRASVHEAGR